MKNGEVAMVCTMGIVIDFDIKTVNAHGRLVRKLEATIGHFGEKVLFEVWEDNPDFDTICEMMAKGVALAINHPFVKPPNTFVSTKTLQCQIGTTVVEKLEPMLKKEQKKKAKKVKQTKKRERKQKRVAALYASASASASSGGSPPTAASPSASSGGSPPAEKRARVALPAEAAPLINNQRPTYLHNAHLDAIHGAHLDSLIASSSGGGFPFDSLIASSSGGGFPFAPPPSVSAPESAQGTAPEPAAAVAAVADPKPTVEMALSAAHILAGVAPPSPSENKDTTHLMAMSIKFPVDEVMERIKFLQENGFITSF